MRKFDDESRSWITLRSSRFVCEYSEWPDSETAHGETRALSPHPLLPRLPGSLDRDLQCPTLVEGGGEI